MKVKRLIGAKGRGMGMGQGRSINQNGGNVKQTHGTLQLQNTEARKMEALWPIHAAFNSHELSNKIPRSDMRPLSMGCWSGRPQRVSV